MSCTVQIEHALQAIQCRSPCQNIDAPLRDDFDVVIDSLYDCFA